LDCVFCRIVSGEIPARVLHSSDRAMAFLDAFPVARGHALVIPKIHCERIQDMPADTGSEVFDLVCRLASKTDRVSGSTLVAVHNGRGSGQDIPHVHVHLIPRRAGDGAGPVHSMFGGTVQLDDETASGLQSDLKL